MKRFTLGFLMALAILGLASCSAQAQVVVVREKTLTFQRTDAALSPPSYVTSFSDGNHPVAGRGIAVAPQDTAIVDISDHFYRYQPNVIRAFPGAGTAGDSVWVGTLSIKGSGTTIDSVTFFRDVSADGFTWTTVDSSIAHIVSGQVPITVYATASDSARAILASTLDPVAPNKQAVISLFAYPAMSSGGITAQALNDVNFIRFRMRMTVGDFAAAGTTGGFTATFRYPAVRSQ